MSINYSFVFLVHSDILNNKLLSLSLFLALPPTTIRFTSAQQYKWHDNLTDVIEIVWNKNVYEKPNWLETTNVLEGEMATSVSSTDPSHLFQAIVCCYSSKQNKINWIEKLKVSSISIYSKELCHFCWISKFQFVIRRESFEQN